MAHLDESVLERVGQAQVVQVKTWAVEKNGPFKIVLRANQKLPNGDLVNVYIITLADKDPRWFTEAVPAFELFFLGDTDVLAKVPSCDFAYLHDQESEEEGMREADINDQGDVDAINVSRNGVVNNTSRHYNYYRLVFPEALDNEVLSPDATDGKIVPKIYPVIGEWNARVTLEDGTQEMQSFASYRTNIQWKIAVSGDKRATVVSRKKGNEFTDQSAGLFGSMSMKH